jgi:hypothetical protein
MTADNRAVSRPRFWTGWILTALSGLFLLFDAVGKLAMPLPVVEAFTRLGVPTSLGIRIGIILLACTAIYLIPRTAVLGAVLLSGYLGGAVAIHLRAGSTLFETIFPILFAIIAWTGIYLRQPQLGAILPWRRG